MEKQVSYFSFVVGIGIIVVLFEASLGNIGVYGKVGLQCTVCVLCVVIHIRTEMENKSVLATRNLYGLLLFSRHIFLTSFGTKFS